MITIAITGNMISGSLRTDTDARIRNVKLFWKIIAVSFKILLTTSKCAYIHVSVRLQRVYFMVCKLYLNKTFLSDPDIPVAPGEQYYVLDPSLDEVYFALQCQGLQDQHY